MKNFVQINLVFTFPLQLIYIVLPISPVQQSDSHIYTQVHSFLLLLHFRAKPAAYGVSQARGSIQAVAAVLQHSHSNTGSELRLRPTPKLMATCRILNPLSKARDQTQNLKVPTQIRFCCATTGTPMYSLFLTLSSIMFHPK